MADTTIRKLLVKFGIQADTDQLARFDAGVEDAAKSLREMAVSASRTVADIVGVSQASSEAGDAAGEVAAEMSGAAQAVDALGAASNALAPRADEAADAVRVEADAVDAVAQASDRAAPAVQRLGAASVEAGFDTLTAAKSFTEGFERFESGVNKAATGVRDLALAGAGLIASLAGITFTTAAAAAAGDDLGDNLNAGAVPAAVELYDSLVFLQEQAIALRNTFGLALIPEINRLLTRFRDWFTFNREVIDQRLDDYAERIGKAITSAASTVDTIVEKIGGWDVAIQGVTAGFAALTAAWVAFKVGTVIAGLVQIGTAIAAIGTPLLFVVGAALSLAQAVAVWASWALVLEDIATYLDGGDSLLGRFIDRFREGDGILGAFARALESAFGFLREVLPIAAGLLDQVVGIFARLAEIAAPAIDIIAKAFGAWLEGFLLPVTLALETISGLFDALASKAPQIGSALSSALGGVAGLLGADTSNLAPSAPDGTVGGASVSNSQSSSYSYTFNGLDTSDIEALMASQQEADARAVSEAATAGVA